MSTTVIHSLVMGSVWLALMAAAAVRAACGVPAVAHGELFDTICKMVADDFYSPELNGLDWEAVGRRFRPEAEAATSREQFAEVVNRMLATLRTSHTHYFTPDDPRYFQLLGVFEDSGAYAEEMEQVRQMLSCERIGYTGIAVDIQTTGDGVFASAVFEGGPAHEAGIQVGTRLVAVDGQPFHPVRSFAGQAGRQLAITVQDERNGPRRTVDITPRFLRTGDMFEDALRGSIRVFQRGDYRIGYVHVWSYAGNRYQELLEEALFEGALHEADALLLDVRDGWGGASPEYLNLFNRQVPETAMIRRNGAMIRYGRIWRRPAALLINGNVRSGKEVFAWGFKRQPVGPVIGERTAGAVMAGALRFLPDHSVLYLAVGDVLVEGQRLEGVGVAPTIEIARPIPFSQGRDPQLDVGLDELERMLQKQRDRPPGDATEGRSP